MKVINKVIDYKTDEDFFVSVRNYLGRRLCWFVKVACTTKDPCKSCDFYDRPICFEVRCSPENRGACYKVIHEGDVLVSSEGFRVYVAVTEDSYLKVRLATQEDLNSDRNLHRISPGVYLYRGHWIRDLGYYEPDKKVVWEAEPVNNQTLGASAHGFSLRDCLTELRMALGEGGND